MGQDDAAVSDTDRLHGEGDWGRFLPSPHERRLQTYEVTVISHETKIPAENVTAGILDRAQLLKLVDVLTRPKPKPKPNPRSERPNRHHRRGSAAAVVDAIFSCLPKSPFRKGVRFGEWGAAVRRNRSSVQV
jgi:hypothetical protein